MLKENIWIEVSEKNEEEKNVRSPVRKTNTKP